MAGAEAACESAVLPGMVQVKACVGTFMPHPAAARSIDVRSVRVSGLIVKIAMFFRGVLVVHCAVCSGRRSMGRNVTMPNTVLTAVFAGMFFAMLAKCQSG